MNRVKLEPLAFCPATDAPCCGERCDCDGPTYVSFGPDQIDDDMVCGREDGDPVSGRSPEKTE